MAEVQNENNYSWRQTLQDVTITVPVPEGTRGKQVQVTFSPKGLKMGLVGQPLIIDGELHANIAPEESTWTVEDQKEVTICIEKINKQEWWPCVILGDTMIDVSKIAPENSKLSDLDDETRAMVEKMMHEQAQKEAEKSKPADIRNHPALAKFQAEHPEIDLSHANINN